MGESQRVLFLFVFPKGIDEFGYLETLLEKWGLLI